MRATLAFNGLILQNSIGKNLKPLLVHLVKKTKKAKLKPKQPAKTKKQKKICRKKKLVLTKKNLLPLVVEGFGKRVKFIELFV